MPLQRGTRLGPYQIESPLGAGRMGEVYKATDTRLEYQPARSVLGTLRRIVQRFSELQARVPTGR